jgi:hypothetical protein
LWRSVTWVTLDVHDYLAEEAVLPSVPPGLPVALQSLDQALDAPRRPGIPLGNWRWLVRQRMTTVRDALMGEGAGAETGWLAARGGTAFRERNALLGRLGDLAPRVLEASDVEAVRVEGKRLIVDIQRHLSQLGEPAHR